jgi:type IV pilus assembly protein PilF
MKIFQSLYLSLFIIIFFVGGCAKKQNNKKLADTYFKMALYELGQETVDAAACQRALAHLSQALTEHEAAQYYGLQATILMNLGHFDQSEQSFKKAFACKAPVEVVAQINNNYACLLAQRGNTAQATDLLNKVINNPLYATPEVAWVNLGRLALDQNDTAKAYTSFSNALLLAPDYVDAHYYRALTAYQQGKAKLCQRDLSAVLRQVPYHEGACALLTLLKKA